MAAMGRHDYLKRRTGALDAALRLLLEVGRRHVPGGVGCLPEVEVLDPAGAGDVR